MTYKRNVNLVTTDVAKMFEAMEPRHIALLVAKILNPDKSIISITEELWPELGHARRKQIMGDAKIDAVMKLIREKPWVMTTIMAGKLAPVAVSTLFELSQSADKDNVRATAAKELVRLAQSTAHQIQINDGELEGVDALDDLANSTEVTVYDGGDTIEADEDDFDILDDNDA